MPISKILTDRRLWLLLAAGLAFALLRWTGAMDLLSLDTLKTHRETLVAWVKDSLLIASLA